MNLHLDILHFKSEIDRLSGMAEVFRKHGMTEKAAGYESYINILRTRLDKFELIEYWEADDEFC